MEELKNINNLIDQIGKTFKIAAEQNMQLEKELQDYLAGDYELVYNDLEDILKLLTGAVATIPNIYRNEADATKYNAYIDLEGQMEVYTLSLKPGYGAPIQLESTPKSQWGHRIQNMTLSKDMAGHILQKDLQEFISNWLYSDYKEIVIEKVQEKIQSIIQETSAKINRHNQCLKRDLGEN